MDAFATIATLYAGLFLLMRFVWSWINSPAYLRFFYETHVRLGKALSITFFIAIGVVILNALF